MGGFYNFFIVLYVGAGGGWRDAEIIVSIQSFLIGRKGRPQYDLTGRLLHCLQHLCVVIKDEEDQVGKALISLCRIKTVRTRSSGRVWGGPGI